MTRVIVLAFTTASLIWVATHRAAAGCALVALAAGLDHAGASLIPDGRRDPIARMIARAPQVEPPADLRERIEDRMLDAYCRACPERRKGKERWLP